MCAVIDPAVRLKAPEISEKGDSIMKAIDTHVHPGTREYLVDSGGKYMDDAMHYFHKHNQPVSVEEMARIYQEADMMAVVTLGKKSSGGLSLWAFPAFTAPG
jgi:hypothetical protein